MKLTRRLPRSLRLLMHYYQSERRRLRAGISFLLLANVAGLVSPAIIRVMIDGLNSDLTQGALLRLAAAIVLLAAISGVLLFFQRRLIIGVARDMEYRLRNEFYAHLQKLSPEFYQANRTGDLMARATSDLAAIRTLTGLGLIATFNTVFALSLTLPMMISANWKLTALSFLPFPALAALGQVFSKRIHQRAQEVQASYGRLSSNVQENLTGVRVVRSCGQEDAEILSFRENNRHYMDCNLSLIKLTTIFRFVLQFLVALGFLLVFVYGGYLITQHVITIGMFIQQTLYLGLLIGPVASSGLLVNLYQRAMASMGRIQAIMTTEPAIRDDAAMLVDVPVRGDIEFRDLTFTFPNSEQPVLKNINLKIQSGQVVALVGGVGSGKTTLMNLACRLLDAETGQILIDGRPIQQVPLRTLRSAIGYVPQETVLFSETVAANIAFGMDERVLEAVAKAAEEAALAADLASFPLGLQTLVGERGISLSGGQGQRVAMARALLRVPRILLLDDALSAVDTDTEEEILNRLRRSLVGRTALISSHRISTIKDADLIVVLEQGCIVQRGTHDELLEQGGCYADFYKKQMLESELVNL